MIRAYGSKDCGINAVFSTKKNPQKTKQISPKFPYVQVCCNGTIYPSSDYACCQNKLHRRQGGARLRCCDDKAFNEQTQVCCGNKVTSVASPYSTSCCGETPYNYFNEQCCDSKVTSTRKYLCCDGRSIANMGDQNLACCGKGVYNMIKGVCCEGTFHPGDPNRLSCCRARTYDSHTQVFSKSVESIFQ